MPTTLSLLSQPWRVWQGCNRRDLWSDVAAGLTVATVLAPQAIAFASLAELPPQAGLYTALMAAVVGALWGSSRLAVTGPSNSISLLVLSVLTGVAVPGTADYILAAGLLALMAGGVQLALGLSRLGGLAHFVSHSVAVGFAAGAAALIILRQVPHLLGLQLGTGSLTAIVRGLIGNVSATHLPTAALGLATVAALWLARRYMPRRPATLPLLVLLTAVVAVFRLDRYGVAVIGTLPGALPGLAPLPVFNLDLIADLATGALALAAIGLVQATTITHALAAKYGQRVDNNREFVGQGLANLVSGLFSGYAASASFAASAVNDRAGARSPLAAVCAGLCVGLATLLLAPLAAFLPRAALAGVLILSAIGMIDRADLRRMLRGAPGDALIVVVTFLGTLLLRLEFAVLAGVLLSFGLYIVRTSMPRVFPVVPDADFKHLVPQAGRPACPQLGIVVVQGDLYFGAVGHVEEVIADLRARAPGQRFLLLRAHGVHQCDYSGIHMLENLVRLYREGGGDLYVEHVQPTVRRFMHDTGFLRLLGKDHFLSKDVAIHTLFHRVVDPAVCIYECDVRVFAECQNLPRPDQTGLAPSLPPQRVPPPLLAPGVLWSRLHQADPPLVIDVREPMEYRRGHVPGSRLAPLPRLVEVVRAADRRRAVVLVCRGGRRSLRAAALLAPMGFTDVSVLQGGMLAWEAAGCLTAIEYFEEVADAHVPTS